MANAIIAMDKYIDLGDTSLDHGTLSWTTASDVNTDSPVIDFGEEGALTEGIDTWAAGDITYSGYTVNIGGMDYGIFVSAESSNGYIPYHTDIDDISTSFPLGVPGSSSTYQPVLTTAANCFLTGTRIATPSGEVAIEDLHTGDMVQSADGRAVPIRWLAQQTVANIRNIVLTPKLEPVVITAGALGNGLPVADLYVSADHGMILDGLVINASTMVNGTTIRFVPLAEMPARFVWWHIETEAHDVLLANGAAAESFIDYNGRKAFDNYDEYLGLYGADRLIREMPGPRVSARRQLPPALRARLGIGSTAPDMAEIAHLLDHRAA